MRTLLTTAALCALFAPAFAQQTTVEPDMAALTDLYEHFHANPELSFMEAATAKRLARELKRAGFEVTTGVGRTGVVAVMSNGEGPTIMLRADMDGLPLTEQTDLPYASKATGEDRFGETFPTMHACGHDVHMTSLVGAARQLAARKDSWSGTLVLIGQPAEEIGEGALAMIEDGLYERFPKPDAVLALHDSASLPAGQVAYSPGFALANVDSVDIRVKGVGGHGAYPHTTVDPIVIGARIVTAVQTLVSREVSPLTPAVVTVGAFNAGTKHNIISDGAHLQLTVRSFDDETRETLLRGIQRIAEAQARSAGLDDDMLPEVTVSLPYTPSTFNDPALSERVAETLRGVLGPDNVMAVDPVMGGEDFSQFGREAQDVPTMIFWLGAVAPDAVRAAATGGEPLPSLHSPFFAPAPEPTLRTGVVALTEAALSLFAEAPEAATQNPGPAGR